MGSRINQSLKFDTAEDDGNDLPVLADAAPVAGYAKPESTSLAEFAASVGLAPSSGSNGSSVTTGASSIESAAVFASTATLAAYLVNGYWGGSGHHWGSNTISVNLNGLALAGELAFARQALIAWSRVANLTFVETTGAANITFTDGGNTTTYVASTSASYSGGIMSTSTINISQLWYNQNGGAGGTPGVFSNYGFQTYLHELGHALGLGHQGPYNGSATYGTDNIYTDDSWQFSVMSYFSQSNYGGASYAYVSGPQMVDILAIQTIYGAASTFTHFYGDGPTVSGSGYNFANGVQSFTMYSSDGWVGLDSSSYAGSQTIHMNAGQYSSVRGLSNNIGQYTQSTMVWYSGGSGIDDVTLNTSNVTGASNQVYGGGGNDIFRDTGLFGGGVHSIDGGTGFDTYTRGLLALGSGATLTRTSQLNNGWLVTSTGGSGNAALTNVEQANFSNVNVSLRQARSNFNFGATTNDVGATSDLVLSNNGSIITWEIQNNTLVGGTSLTASLPGWTVVGTGDFNADGTSDVLLQSGGSFVNWTIQNGTVTAGSVIATGATGWSVRGTGDVNNDGTLDIILQNGVGGAIIDWTMQNGVYAGGNVVIGSATGWNVVGVGDVNGDGTADVVVQNGNAVVAWTLSNGLYSGGSVLSGNTAGFNVVAVGDFNGDGTSDVILQNGGSFVEWTLLNGAYQSGHVLAVGADGYSVVGTGDYNGDGIADVAIQNGGNVVIWTLANGAYTGGTVLGTGLTGYTVFG